MNLKFKQKKILRESNKDALIKLIEDNKVNGWEPISEIVCDYSFDFSNPYQVLMKKVN